MTPEVALYIFALFMGFAWIVIIFVVAWMATRSPPELYTQTEISQMLMTGNETKPRQRMRAGTIKE